MKRRDFFEKSGCAFAGFMAAPLAAGLPIAGGQEKRPRYKIDIEIYEAREDTWCHKKGDKFEYPKDWGKICPWLRTSLNDFVRLLEHGVSLTWKYENTPYEKVIDPGNGGEAFFNQLPHDICPIFIYNRQAFSLISFKCLQDVGLFAPNTKIFQYPQGVLMHLKQHIYSFIAEKFGRGFDLVLIHS